MFVCKQDYRQNKKTFYLAHLFKNSKLSWEIKRTLLGRCFDDNFTIVV